MDRLSRIGDEIVMHDDTLEKNVNKTLCGRKAAQETEKCFP